ncbi:MAG: serine/threonine-protein phosphatase [Gemmataceae bacterium]|nr:serine/threonine-protein phosphatase [Gemmataceae bacterium]
MYRAGRDGPPDDFPAEAVGLPIGVMGGFEYTSVPLDLGPNDLVVLLTDGVIETTSPLGELFGEGGVDRCYVPGESTPAQFGARLVEAVRRHAAGRPQTDDLLVVCFGRVPGEDRP